MENIVVIPDGISVNLTHAAKENEIEFERGTGKNVGSGKLRNWPGLTLTNAFLKKSLRFQFK